MNGKEEHYWRNTIKKIFVSVFNLPHTAKWTKLFETFQTVFTNFENTERHQKFPLKQPPSSKRVLYQRGAVF